MRNSITVSLCGVLVCAGLLLPACGSSDSKSDGPGGLAQDAGSGGRASTGGAGGKGDSGAGGAMGTGGASPAGGAMGTGGASPAGGAMGTGGASPAGGAMGTGGASHSGGAMGTGGATGVDASPGRDAKVAVDGPPASFDLGFDQRRDSDAPDAPLGPDASVDGAITSTDGGSLDSTTIEVDAGPDATSAACAAVGGICMSNRWTLCPARYEPAGEGSGRLDCPSSGLCCVPAPSSPCSDTGKGNCVVGDTCTGCWSPAEGTPACESGRVCCIDICD